MYDYKSYVQRATKFINNQSRSGNKKLATLMIYATDLCDSACKHCLIWAKRPIKHLPKDKIIEIMQSKCVTKNTLVGLEGGEFLLHPEAFEILEWYSKNHPNFDLLSNCLKPQNTIDAVDKYPPKRLYISLDGTKETYKYMRGKDGYDNVLRVIENCRSKVPISVMFTLSPYNNFDDLQHVAEVCKKYDVDLRIGVYNDIAFFDTVEKAHETDLGVVKDEKKVLKYKDVREAREQGLLTKNEELAVLEKEEISNPKHNEQKIRESNFFKEGIPPIVKEFKENYDFLVLYDEWRKKKLKLNCYSILDSLIILPDGTVPICQNLDLELGNIYQNDLNEIFNSEKSQSVQNEYVHNCNQCWVSFHRKYDVVLYRTFEKYFSKAVTRKLFGYYQWEEDASLTYKKYLKKMEGMYGV